MTSSSAIWAFLRALFPETRLLFGGVAVLWGATAVGVLALRSPISPIADIWQPHTADAPAEHRVAALLRQARWSTDAHAAGALWEAALLAATDLNAPERSIAIVERLLQAHPHSPHTTDAMAWRAALLTRIHSPDAGAAYEAVARYSPTHPHTGRWWLAAADQYAVHQQVPSALQAYTHATAHPPQAARAWLALGRLRLDEDPAAAHAAFQDARRVSQRHSTARLARLGAATALERLDGPDAALAEVDEAIALDGPDPSLERRRDRLRNGG